jgi:hypothetical protein
MSSPTDGNGKKGDHSAYAPKRVRDSNRETSHESPSIDALPRIGIAPAIFISQRSIKVGVLRRRTT